MTGKWVAAAVLVLAAVPAWAQGEREELLGELGSRRGKVAAGDTEGLYRVGRWADGVGLRREASRIFKDVLKLDEDHKGARAALGYVRHGGDWVKESDLDKIRAKEELARYKALGWVKYKGDWMPKEQADLMKAGMVRFEDPGTGVMRWLTKEEAKKAEKGWVRWVDGRYYSPEDTQKLAEGLFPIPERKKGRRPKKGKAEKIKWVSEQEADMFHSVLDPMEDAWTFREERWVLYTSLPWEKALEARDAAIEADREIFLRMGEWAPAVPVPLMAFRNREEFSVYGAQFGGEVNCEGLFGAWLSEKDEDRGRPAVLVWEKAQTVEWGPLNLKHAMVHAYMARLPLQPPPWVVEGLAADIARMDSNANRERVVLTYNLQNRLKGPVSLQELVTDFTLSIGQREVSERHVSTAALLFHWAHVERPEGLNPLLDELLEQCRSGDVKAWFKATLALKNWLKEGHDEDVKRVLQQYV